MNINVTVLIQIINFVIAWAVIKKLLVVPAVQLRMQQVAALEELMLRRDTLKKTIDAVFSKQYSLWHRWYLYSQKSVQEYYKPLNTKPSISVKVSTSDISIDKINELTQTLTNMVVTRLQEIP